MDTYRDFADLAQSEREGDDYTVDAVSRDAVTTAIIAPHGGGIEPGTSEVARAIAGDELSFALFEGTKRAGNARLHITSTNFDEPRCIEMVRAATHVVTIHGEGSREPAVYLGGRDTALGDSIRRALEASGYRVDTHDNPELQGTASTNICNRSVRQAGVQLELSEGLRLTFFDSLTREGRKRATAELKRFADAVREGLRNHRAL
jgi:phage replication-related protein YjqB (UPF0714/DUF867 family)